MSLAPFMIVGCGGSGVLSVRHIRDEVRSRLKAQGVDKMPKAWQFIGIDAPSTMTDLGEALPLPPSDYLKLRPGATTLEELEPILKSAHPPQTRGSGYEELIGWRPSPKDLKGSFLIGMSQNRAVGRVVGTVALNGRAIKDRIQSGLSSCAGGGTELNALAQKMKLAVGGLDAPEPIVIVITSTAGGCGAGIGLDVVDLIRHLDARVQPILIAYGSDIFGAQSSAGMASNNLAFISELLNASWSENGGKTGLFSAPFGLPQSRGPHASFLIGRKNMKGVDLQDSRNIYRAVGISIAGWMTTPSVRQSFQDYVIANWGAAPLRLGGFGFGDTRITGNISSFGSATIAVGRKRFREYARKYLLRDIYEHHFRGYKKVATTLFGESVGTDAALKSRIVERFTPEVTTAFGLTNLFDAQGGILSDGSAQISDALLSRAHVQKLANDVAATLSSRLPGESLRGAEWSGLIRDELSVIKRQVIIDGVESYKDREELWLANLVKQVVSKSNDYLAQLTLPVMVDLAAHVIESVQRASIAFRNSAQVASDKANEFGLRGYEQLADVGTNNLTKDSPQVSEAINVIAASIGQEMKAQVSTSIAQTLDQVVINLLQPLRAALMRASDDVALMTDSKNDKPSEISGWPVADIIPTALIPSPIEHLLEGHEEWAATLQRLLRSAEKQKVGEAMIDSVRRGIASGVETSGEIGSAQVRPLLWTRNDAPLEFARSQPLALDLGLDIESLEERVDQWLSKPGRELSDYLREGLQGYLSDPMHPDHNRRLAKFKEKFQMALEQSSPLVEVDNTYFATTYPLQQQLSITYSVEPIPFQPGHPAYQVAEEQLRNALGLVPGAPTNLYFDDSDRESITTSCFFAKPVFVGVIKSVMDDLARHGSQLKSPEQLRGWLDFKRSRTLDEFIPLPEKLTFALIRGFAVGRMLGLIDTANGSPIKISSLAGTFEFPEPGYSSIPREYALTSLLMSFSLSFLKVSQMREKAFAAYGELFNLGVPDHLEMNPLEYRVSGELQLFLENGKTKASSINTPQCEGSNKEERTASAKEYLTDNIEFYSKLIDEPFKGDECVRTIVKWERNEIPVREAAEMIRDQYKTVLSAIEIFSVGANTSSKIRT